jgi:O-antigen/teichoic acid export membrane protein
MQYKTFAGGVVSSTYHHIFHKDISESMAVFLKNLGYVVSGTLPSIVLLSAFNIIAARMLGPMEYGRYTLIQSVAAFLGISMIMGYHTTITKFLPENPDEASRSKTISSVYILTFLFTLATVLAALAFMPQLSGIFNMTPEFLLLAVMFAVVYTFYTLTTNTLRGMLQMKLYSLFQVAYAALVLVIFLIMMASGPLTYQSILLPVFIAYGITGLAIFWLIRKYLALKLDLSWIAHLTHYSLYCVVGAVAFTIYSNIDKILININLTPTDLGIYGAYYIATINVVSIITTCFITVFFPTISQYRDKNPIFGMFARVIPYMIIGGVPFIIFCEVVIIRLYGTGYPLYLDLVLLFALAGICQSIQHLYGWILNSDNGVGVKISTGGVVVMVVLDTCLNIVLIPAMGIRGAVIALMLSHMVTFLFLITFKKRYYGRGELIAGN